jgi:site-specific recombinase XerD
VVTPPATQLRALFETNYLASKSPGTRACYRRSIGRLEAWAKRETLDLGQLQTTDLRRFLAEQGRQYAPGSIKVSRAALRAFYQCLYDAGAIEDDPAYRLRHMTIGHPASSQPIAYLTDEDIAHVRAIAHELGAVHSLVVCLLHETPIAIAGVARLSLADLAEDRTGKTFLILGRTAASRTPRPLSDQARTAITSLRSSHARLISPTTKNPNQLVVRAALEQTRKQADLQTPDLAAALKGTQRREERELCEQLRLKPQRLSEYRRQLLPELKPLAA